MSQITTHLLPVIPTTNILDAALTYHDIGFSIIPLKGKQPTLKTWKFHQTERQTKVQIQDWHQNRLLNNIGVVCGAVSNNLVVLDFDGLSAYAAFTALFPTLSETYTIATGSGKGKHVYLYVDKLPPTTRALDTPIGHIELRADGCYVVAPLRCIRTQAKLIKSRRRLTFYECLTLTTWSHGSRNLEFRYQGGDHHAIYRQ